MKLALSVVRYVDILRSAAVYGCAVRLNTRQLGADGHIQIRHALTHPVPKRNITLGFV